jgi:glyoxylase-like metal-dependent hydrolase (beta-lactamase superfamily II)/rhodanese-related sulfurtransferase
MMFFKRYYLGCLAHASYMIADEETGVAAVIDPQRDIDQYMQDAKENGFQIRYVFLTHFHADFIAGHIELRDKVGASIYLGARAEADYDFTPVKEGDVIEVGKVRFRVMETPGHTPEGISILLYDLDKSDKSPTAVLTGDTLFIGDVGRPDLLASIGVTGDQLADMLFDSLHEKLLSLPDDTLVYPAHGAGSMCGKNLSDEAVSTIGEQRRYNYALQPMSREEFVQLVTAEQPEAPDYFVHDAILNRQERENLEGTMQKSLQPLSLDEVLKMQADGVQVVDVRDGTDFAGAHLSGSINIPLDGKYATWAGSVLSNDRPIVVVADPNHQQEAVMRLGRIGFDNAIGFLEGGLEAVENHPELVRHMERITAPALAERLQSTDADTVIDVRSRQEWERGHIAGSINLPLNRLTASLDKVPAAENLFIHCQGGYRSSVATSLLQRHGFQNVTDLVGGLNAWRASKLPVVEEAASVALNQ